MTTDIPMFMIDAPNRMMVAPMAMIARAVMPMAARMVTLIHHLSGAAISVATGWL